MKRWIIVSIVTGAPVGLRISYPTKTLCERFCGPNEVAKEVEAVAPSGPFSDFVG
jgi:hypothetical protein